MNYDDTLEIFIFDNTELEFCIWENSCIEVFLYSDTELEAILV